MTAVLQLACTVELLLGSMCSVLQLPMDKEYLLGIFAEAQALPFLMAGPTPSPT